jgi:hypothetical protein
LRGKPEPPDDDTVATPVSGADQQKAARGFSFTMGGLVVIFIASALARVLAIYLNGPVNQISSTFALVWPVTWRFYINPDRSETTVAYLVNSSGQGFDQIAHSTVGGAGYWGLDHSTYGDLARLATAFQTIPPGTWRNCAAPAVTDCAAIIATAPRATIPSPFTSVCGPTVFTVQRPGTQREDYARQVVRVAVVDLTCPR